MFGTTLVELRERVESLAGDDGEYYLVCGRTAERPVPAAGQRFPTRAVARSAVRATEQYRATLRRYDPRLPPYDLIVCQDADPRIPTARHAEGDGTASRPERRRPIECCHRVAAAVFETLSEGGHEDVETAVLDAYLDLAETVPDPDDLCLRLLESTATELDARLAPGEQADVLARAARRLPPRPSEPAEHPVTATLDRLRRAGLLGEFSRSPWRIDPDDGTRSVIVLLSGYALAPRRDRLPVLPLVLELNRRPLDRPPLALRVAETDGGWRVTLTLAADGQPTGLASAPIEPAG